MSVCDSKNIFLYFIFSVRLSVTRNVTSYFTCCCFFFFFFYRKKLQWSVITANIIFKCAQSNTIFELHTLQIKSCLSHLHTYSSARCHISVLFTQMNHFCERFLPVADSKSKYPHVGVQTDSETSGFKQINDQCETLQSQLMLDRISDIKVKHTITTWILNTAAWIYERNVTKLTPQSCLHVCWLSSFFPIQTQQNIAVQC